MEICKIEPLWLQNDLILFDFVYTCYETSLWVQNDLGVSNDFVLCFIGEIPMSREFRIEDDVHWVLILVL